MHDNRLSNHLFDKENRFFCQANSIELCTMLLKLSYKICTYSNEKWI